MSEKRILVIGASHSSGVTGVEADQKVIAAHGCDATTVTTALTAQSIGADDEQYCPPAVFVKKAIDGCFDGGGVEVVKIGVLASAEVVQIVVDALRRHDTNFVVVDQVPHLESETGPSPHLAIQLFQTALLQLTTVLTLSVSEALFLLRKAGAPFVRETRNLDDLIHLAKAVYGFGPEYVLLQGYELPLTGNLEPPKHDSDKQIVVHVLYDGTDATLIKTAHVTTGIPQGAASALGPAIASNLALGDAVPLAAQKACRYIEAGISNGSGRVNYFHSTYVLPFSPGYFIEYLLNREDVKPVWHAHVHHGFVQRIGDGTLPVEKFKNYLVQDYLFLVQFARAKALSAYKSNSMADIAAAAGEILHIQREMSLHLDYCAEFGLSKEEVEKQEEHQACTAYTRYVLDVAHAQSHFALQVAFAPCLLGYGAIARRLHDDPGTVSGERGNRYWRWIENYVADDYTDAVGKGEEVLETQAVLQSASQIEALVGVFLHATRMETGFWDMGCE